MVAVFLMGVTNLFSIRFNKGDIYPYYSSMRADAMGTKALYETFDQINDVSVKRNFDKFSKLEEPENSALVIVGSTPGLIQFCSEDKDKSLDSYAANGARIVIAFRPDSCRYCDMFNTAITKNSNEKSENTENNKNNEIKPNQDKDKDLDKKTTEKNIINEVESKDKNKDKNKDESIDKNTNNKKDITKEKSNDDKEKDDKEKDNKKKENLCKKELTLAHKWNIKVSQIKEKISKEEQMFAFNYDEQSIKTTQNIPWRSNVYFENIGESWRVIYSFKHYPVVVERNWGQGSIVLLSSSYLMSNEALVNDRHPNVLSWLIGSKNRIIFDETHLGIQKNYGISYLLKKYNLFNILPLIILLMALLLWRNLYKFIPVSKQTSTTLKEISNNNIYGSVAMTNLLSSNVKNNKLLELCYNEWFDSIKSNYKYTNTQIEKIKQVIKNSKENSKEQNIEIKTYNKICKILENSKV